MTAGKLAGRVVPYFYRASARVDLRQFPQYPVPVSGGHENVA
jgi:hypothetical protein